ncbi:acetyl-CoA carboxylase biotin carboxylase subunit [Candidatus Enterococcus mansonii]|uniref:biotin carboxylase n=1 Tax=Candidatus Enterococcus mansonii TaxID=1834181 RepID=A0A242CDU7_9ENTE|nr:acetyl-CoA carboxylase biotin carboxylase subunit [Enterococcus sp. 4G2_DIV0659]OTO07952.1 acetyl-CoA carboxylase, biotin carboxylase subunit [Enterococcus sp. 4G2_DIV0659]
MIQKVLIANRGEIAIRIIKACKELGITTVAVYSEADKEALHVAFADEAYQIGPASSIDSYLKVEAIVNVAKITGCQAVHPGYGFLSENMELCRMCEEEGITFIGPSLDNLSQLADKFEAKRLAKTAGITVIPGNHEVIETTEQLQKEAGKLNFPILLKATHGGGGKGIKRCENLEELLHYYEIIKKEAEKAFNNQGCYIEECIQQFLHVEVQILGDSQGNIIHLGERNCSIQRKMQKIIEETPSPLLDEEIRTELCEAACRFSERLNYLGAGTVEFLYDYKKKCFYFMEMNTRVQVEHPITEMISGVDIIKEQITIAAGLPLSCTQENIQLAGYSLECRINAEDPENNFFPSAGKIDFLVLPTGSPGVRVDTFIYSGYQVPLFYDSMLGKIIVHDKTRAGAIKKLKVALETTIISGIKTNVSFLLAVLSDHDFISGHYDNHFIEENIQNEYFNPKILKRA